MDLEDFLIISHLRIQGDAKHYGLEYNSNWRFLDDWIIMTNFSLLKARLKNENRDLSNAPNYKYNFALKYMPEMDFMQLLH